MRFLSKIVDCKDKIVQKVASMESADATPRRKHAAVCGPLIIHDGLRRVNSATDSMLSSTSHHSEDTVASFHIKRLSCETASISIASSSASSTSSSHMMDELEELLLAVHAQIAESNGRRADILAYEDSFHESKALVRRMAQELVMKIRAHEVRLLEEIETRRETMYKKLGLALCNGREKLDKHIKHMEKLHSEGEAIMSDSVLIGHTPDLNPQYSTVLQKLNNVLEEAKNMPGADVKILPVCVSPVRCNTAFACLDAHTEQLNTDHTICHRRKSMPHKPSSYHRSRSNSLQASNSVGGNMQHLAVATQEFGRGGSMQRRLSVQHNSPRHLVTFTHTLTDNCQNAHRLSENNEATTKLLWSNTTEGPLGGEINCPNDICFLPNSNLVVSDRDNYRLQVFTKDGKYIRSIGEGKIKPRRIAITRDGHIAVTDSKDNMIKVYNTQGCLLNSWGKKRFKQMFKAPCAIACTARGQYIVSDMECHTVSMHNSDGKLLRHLGGENGGDAEFHSPSYIAVNPHDNNIIVADNSTHSLHIFDENGNFKLNAHSCEDMKYPNGIACTGDGSMFVALWGTHAVAALNSMGKFSHMLLTRHAHNIYHPAGIALHGNMLAISEYSDTHSALRIYTINSTGSR